MIQKMCLKKQFAFSDTFFKTQSIKFSSHFVEIKKKNDHF